MTQTIVTHPSPDTHDPPIRLMWKAIRLSGRKSAKSWHGTAETGFLQIGAAIDGLDGSYSKGK